MYDETPDAIPSNAAIAGHPIHPLLIPFPIASMVGAFVTDLVANSRGDAFFTEASRWLLLAGLVTGALAAVFGLWDFLTISRVRSITAAWIHFLGNAAALVLTFINLMTRAEGQVGVDGLNVGLSLLVTLILLVTGWLGGELSYRYRVGVMESEHQRVPETSRRTIGGD